MPRTLELHFDYLSPYSYLAWHRMRKLCAERELKLRPKPTLLAGLLQHWGQLGPAEIPPKRQFVVRDTLRIAARRKLPLRPPVPHPFNPLAALRASLEEVSGDRQLDVVDAIFNACWGRGENIGDEATLIGALEAAGLDGRALIERTRAPEIKARLREETEQAIARGVFGVPTVALEGQLFWGDDQLESICGVLDGTDPIDAHSIDSLTERAPGLHRPRKP